MERMNLEISEYSNFLPRKDAARGTNTAFKHENKFLYCSFWKYYVITEYQNEEPGKKVWKK